MVLANLTLKKVSMTKLDPDRVLAESSFLKHATRSFDGIAFRARAFEMVEVDVIEIS
jgi:hypothetical protein